MPSGGFRARRGLSWVGSEPTSVTEKVLVALGHSRGTVRAQLILPECLLRPPKPFAIAAFRNLRP